MRAGTPDFDASFAAVIPSLRGRDVSAWDRAAHRRGGGILQAERELVSGLLAHWSETGPRAGMDVLNRFRRVHESREVLRALRDGVCRELIDGEFAAQAAELRAWALLTGIDAAVSSMVVLATGPTERGVLHLRKGGYRWPVGPPWPPRNSWRGACGAELGEPDGAKLARRGEWAGRSDADRCPACEQWANETGVDGGRGGLDQRLTAAVADLDEPYDYPLFGGTAHEHVRADARARLGAELSRMLRINLVAEGEVAAMTRDAVLSAVYAHAISLARTDRHDRVMQQAFHIADPHEYRRLVQLALSREHGVSVDGPLGGLLGDDRWRLALGVAQAEGRLDPSGDPGQFRRVGNAYRAELESALREALGPPDA